MNKYKNHLNYNYCNTKLNNDAYINRVPVNSDVGYIELYITQRLGTEFPTNAVVTIYVRHEDNQIPVKNFVVTTNPTIIELPVANPQGTLIEGPEYFFTPYDLTIESEGYFKISTLNIRLFPKITTRFYYNLNEIMQNEPYKEEVINLPTHPKDIL
nr:hypothetical protein [Sedimentibacter sp.]